MAQWQGLELEYADGRTTNVIQTPENIKHAYVGGRLVVYAVGYDAKGQLPDFSGLPAANRAPGMVIASGSVNWPEPHAKHREDGTIETGGYDPTEAGKVPVFLMPTPALVLTPEQEAAKRFHDALADPSSLVKGSAPDRTADFVRLIVDAVRSYVG